MSDVHRKNPGAGCAFSALAPEIARSDKRTRALTSEQVRDDIELIARVAARQGQARGKIESDPDFQRSCRSDVAGPRRIG